MTNEWLISDIKQQMKIDPDMYVDVIVILRFQMVFFNVLRVFSINFHQLNSHVYVRNTNIGNITCILTFRLDEPITTSGRHSKDI